MAHTVGKYGIKTLGSCKLVRRVDELQKWEITQQAEISSHLIMCILWCFGGIQAGLKMLHEPEALERKKVSCGRSLLGLVATNYLTSLCFVCFVLGLVCLIARFNIFRFLYYLKHELLASVGVPNAEAVFLREDNLATRITNRQNYIDVLRITEDLLLYSRYFRYLYSLHTKATNASVLSLVTATLPRLLLVLATSSSESALPSLMEKLQAWGQKSTAFYQWSHHFIQGVFHLTKHLPDPRVTCSFATCPNPQASDKP